MNKKYFIITIDNEEDNQWNPTAPETTINARYLQRFQTLCESFSFKPVYLTTYNMGQDPEFANLAIKALKNGNCEIGMHLHAWSTPPEYELKKVNSERPYLIEYPKDIMKKKIEILHESLTNKYGEITTHRAGRWAMNANYFEILGRYGYNCDCSVTPGKKWTKNVGATGLAGPDYSNAQNIEYYVNDKMLEVPVTIRKLHYFDPHKVCSLREIAREASHLIRGKQIWMRPSYSSLFEMKYLADYIAKSDEEYLMFMIHSSELMPGGSPYYKTEDDIEELYLTLHDLFKYIAKNYEGITLKEFVKRKREKIHG